MRVLIFMLLLLSTAGFVLSVLAHVFALFGLMPPGGDLVMSLHIGVFVVWIPAVLLSTRVTKNANRNDFWKIMFSGCPLWMRYTFYGLFGYAILNFLLFIATDGAQHQGSNAVSVETVRGFSGHWMVFYGAAFSMFYSILKSPQLLQQRKCINGHVVSFGDAYCHICGSSLVVGT